jgi:hypothetical protein
MSVQRERVPKPYSFGDTPVFPGNPRFICAEQQQLPEAQPPHKQRVQRQITSSSVRRWVQALRHLLSLVAWEVDDGIRRNNVAKPHPTQRQVFFDRGLRTAAIHNIPHVTPL